ncbi:MAG: hypothetical protein HUU10_03620 [Bacteroidetes bacterium]|nr:hypothetical protein [Bacteroidota bacterium]
MKKIVVVFSFLLINCSGQYDLIVSGMKDYDFEIPKENLNRELDMFINLNPGLQPIADSIRDSIYVNDDRISEYKTYSYVFTYNNGFPEKEFRIKLDSVDTYLCTVRTGIGAFSPSVIRLNGYLKKPEWSIKMSVEERNEFVLMLFEKKLIGPFREYINSRN